MHVCVWGGGGGGREGGGSTGSPVVGTPVYNISVCEIDPNSAGVLLHSTTPPAHPAAKWVVPKARVDKPTDCGITSGGPGGLFRCPHHFYSQCSCEYLARFQEFVLLWPIVPEVALRGPGFARGA